MVALVVAFALCYYLGLYVGSRFGRGGVFWYVGLYRWAYAIIGKVLFWWVMVGTVV